MSSAEKPSSLFPFPTQEGPPRRPLFGWVLSINGSILICAGFAGGPLAGNGLCWALLAIFVPSETGYPADAWPLVLGFSVLATAVGGFLLIFGMSEGMRLRERGRRFRYTRAVVPRTGEEPVLLLRTFSDDELLDPRPLAFFQHRYEETLTRTLHKLGPVVCIGRPHDLGFGGAARLYVSDEHWQEAVCHLMRRAIATVIVVGRTEGLWWEITTAMKAVERARLLFFFPYVSKTHRSGSRIADLLEFASRWNLSRRRYNQMEAERQARYQIFRKRFAAECNHSLPAEL
jgi:hypothetical protein